MSGIFVSIGVNLITSNPTKFMQGEVNNSIIVSSMTWLICSVLITILATILETAEEEYSTCALKSLTFKEKNELKHSIYSQYIKKLYLYTLLVIISFGIGILFSLNMMN